MSRTKNAVKKHQADAALIQQQIESLEQKANLLKAENQRIEAHNALVEIINKFQKNALHYRSVMVNSITQIIEKHPGLPEAFKEWPNSELAKRQPNPVKETQTQAKKPSLSQWKLPQPN